MTERPQFVTREAYLDKLRSELVEPKPYKFEGTYVYGGRDDNFQRGSIEIDKEGKVAGFINDSSSICDMHIVEGRICTKNNRTVLMFDKLPTGMLVPIHYYLEKPENGELSGRYDGLWSVKEKITEKNFRKLKKGVFCNQANLTVSEVK
jgi:hypothetical protein